MVANRHDTPASARPTTGQEFMTGSLTQKKDPIVKDLGYEIPTVALQYFFHNLLPSMPQGVDLVKVMAELKKKKVLVKNRWSQFMKDPKAQKGGEDKVFSALASVFECVIQAAQTTCTLATQTNPTSDTPNKAPLDQRYAFMLTPHNAPQSERNSTTKPDGFMVDVKKYNELTKDAKKKKRDVKDPKGGTTSWYDIAFPGEWKSDDVDKISRDDNVAKELYSLKQVMSLDPRRRFAFGMTIENRTTRLWFCSRAVMMVSEEFDFVEEPEKLARVFISLAFATEVDMGWDPTIAFKENNDRTSTRVYDITVKDRVYTTVRVLSDFAADNILGRATRVFEVTDPQGTLCVLKDAWIDDDRLLEDQIQKDIIAAVTERFGAEKGKHVQKHFMTILATSTVDVRRDVRDHTTEIMMNKVTPESTRITVAADKDAHLATRVYENVRRTITGRIHVRTVYREVAVTVAKLQLLSDVFLVLHDIVEVLSFIHQSGWVHRDISAGNLYLYFKKQEQGAARGLLGDLEYAKVTGKGAAREVRTGTLDFMATEVIERRYKYQPLGPKNGRSHFYTDDESDSLFGAPSIQPDAPFYHNMLHDLESVWWIAVWVLFFNDDADDQSNEARLRSRNLYTVRLFPRTLDSLNRETFFKQERFYQESIGLLPLKFQNAANVLAAMARSLMDDYTVSEKSIPESLDKGSTTSHINFMVLLKTLKKKTVGTKLVSTPSFSKSKGTSVVEDAEDAQPCGKKLRTTKDQSRKCHSLYARISYL